jgi:hypothetical protein
MSLYAYSELCGIDFPPDPPYERLRMYVQIRDGADPTDAVKSQTDMSAEYDLRLRDIVTDAKGIVTMRRLRDGCRNEIFLRSWIDRAVADGVLDEVEPDKKNRRRFAIAHGDVE